MMHIIKPGTNIDFVGKRKLWAFISGGLTLISLGLLATKGLNYGVDFSGGAEVLVQVPAGWDIGKVRSAMDEGGVKDPRVVSFGQPEDRQFLVKVAEGDESTLNQVAGKVEGALAKTAGAGQYQVLRTEVVGPAAGSSLRTAGFLSMLYALLCILIYIAVRFDMRYAPGAFLSLAHDTILTLGIWSLLGLQFDLQILGALLALIGYSINDTIVVYDRVREVAADHPEMTIEQAVNTAMNETLGRTILTAVTTFLSALALFLLGGDVLHGFALTFLVGIVIGCYSSIYVATPLVIVMTNYYARRPKKQRPERQIGFRPAKSQG
jgi:preprotein translocase subunit SecF